MDFDRCNLERPAQRKRKDDDRPTNGTPAQVPSTLGRVCHGEINTIMGGLAPSQSRYSSSTGTSKRAQVMNIEAKKPRVNDTISFNKHDFEGVQVPHNDALVVLARIAN